LTLFNGQTCGHLPEKVLSSLYINFLLSPLTGPPISWDLVFYNYSFPTEKTPSGATSSFTPWTSQPPPPCLFSPLFLYRWVRLLLSSIAAVDISLYGKFLWLFFFSCCFCGNLPRVGDGTNSFSWNVVMGGLHQKMREYERISITVFIATCRYWSLTNLARSMASIFFFQCGLRSVASTHFSLSDITVSMWHAKVWKLSPQIAV